MSNKMFGAGILALVLLSVISCGCLKDNDDKGKDSESEEVSQLMKIYCIDGWINNETKEMEKIGLYPALHDDIDLLYLEQNLIIHMSWVDEEPNGSVGGKADIVHINNTDPEVKGFENFAFNQSEYSFTLVPWEDPIYCIEIDFTTFSNPPVGNGLDESSTGMVKFILGIERPTTLKGFNCPSPYPADGGWVELY